jgi:hypothetical protein
MTPLSTAALALVCIAGAGFPARAVHRERADRADPICDTGRFTWGIFASIPALVLGLLVADTTDHYLGKSEQIRQMAAKVIVLDRAATEPTPEAAEARHVLHPAVEHRIEET